MTKKHGKKKLACQICGSLMREYGIKGFYSCPKCTFVTTDISLSGRQAEELYGNSYFNGEEYADYAADEAVIKRNFRSRLATLRKYVDNAETKALFEIGCAYGFFLEEAKPHFKKVAGIDITKEGVSFAKKRCLNVSCGDFLKQKVTGKADVFCMWDTIEHLYKPADFIKKISGQTRENGILAITTGDIGSLNARLRGAKWRQIHPPTHLHYFSKKSLECLLERNGYEVVYAGHPGQHAGLGSILKIMLVVRTGNARLYDMLEKTGITKLQVYFNLGDLIYIIGRKRS